MTFVWLIAILVLVFAGLVILGLAWCLWCRRQDKQHKKTGTSDKMKNQIKIVLPLPPPEGGDGEASMDPTQFSGMETGKTEKTTERSTLREPSEEQVTSSKEQISQAPSVSHNDETLNTAADPHVVKTSTESEDMVSFTPASVTAVISAPISAGATPRIARRIPVKPQPPPPPVLPPPPVAPPTLPAPTPPALPTLTPAPPANPIDVSIMNVPMGGVPTGSDMADTIRSDNLGSFCDEDAGKTPLLTPQRSVTATNIVTGPQTPSTAGSSRLTSFTPSAQTHGDSSSSVGRPV